MGQTQRAGAKTIARSMGDESRRRSGVGRAALSRRRDAGGGRPGQDGRGRLSLTIESHGVDP